MKEYTITYLNEKCDKMFAYLQNSKVDMQNEQEILNRCELLNRMMKVPLHQRDKEIKKVRRTIGSEA